MSASNSVSKSKEIADSYNQSVTSNLSGKGTNISATGGLKLGDVFSVTDSFNSQDVSNYVTNLGAGGSASGNPSAASSSGAGLDIAKILPWFLVAFGAYILLRIVNR